MSFIKRLVEKISGQLNVLVVTAYSLCYNSHVSKSYVIDTVVQPAFWWIENFTALLGPVFVFLVAFLMTTVIWIAYWVGLPYYLEHKNIVLTAALIVLGHYLLINIAFHYWYALRTKPGMPPSNLLQTQVVSVCKKCISPKPPRTHHCSVCNKCILKMDHHCPWLNNCVGHFNHRHFFLYMVFMVTGCLYIMAFGFEICYDEFILRPSAASSNSTVVVALDEPGAFFWFSRHSLIVYEAYMTTACFICLGSLTVWHAHHIHRGQTSIEAHINAAETKRLAQLGQTYTNPYNFGPKHNWYLFLGLVDGRGWLSVLLPSRHPPKGDGLSWDTLSSCDIKWTYR